MKKWICVILVTEHPGNIQVGKISYD